jgi:hypothetical protein
MMATAETGPDGTMVASSTPALLFHEKLWVAYVYAPDGDSLAWQLFTHDVDAATWARRKAETWRERLRSATPLPWCVRVYVNGNEAKDPAESPADAETVSRLKEQLRTVEVALAGKLGVAVDALKRIERTELMYQGASLPYRVDAGVKLVAREALEALGERSPL